MVGPSKSSIHMRKLTLSAVFLSLSLALKFVFPNLYIPLFGQDGMRIGISGIFSIMPSILFGPLYGAIVSGLSDFLGFVLSPTGAYLPQMTLVVALGGAVRGFIWMFLQKKKDRSVRIAVIAIIVLLAVFGFWSIYCLSTDGVTRGFYDAHAIDSIRTETMQPVSRLVISRTIGAKNPGESLAPYIVMFTAAPLGFAGFGILLFPIDFLIRKKMKSAQNQGYILQILIAMLASGLMVSTLNTWVLREAVYDSWKSIPFLVLWLPRIIEEILSNTVKVYFVALFYGLFLKYPDLRKLKTSKT